VSKPVIILDPGHGMSNRRKGVYDPGATVKHVAEEATIVMWWANKLRDELRARRIPVVRTRVDQRDPAPVSARAKIAKDYGGKFMLSLHCNAANGKATGTEVIYRGSENKQEAAAISSLVSSILGLRNRGAKTEDSTQHGRLAVMAFQPTFLLEIGFIDNPGDRERMMDEDLIDKCAKALADHIEGRFITF
jgi:N-acetylmuramoyl-L-alanine amidase